VRRTQLFTLLFRIISLLKVCRAPTPVIHPTIQNYFFNILSCSKYIAFRNPLCHLCSYAAMRYLSFGLQSSTIHCSRNNRFQTQSVEQETAFHITIKRQCSSVNSVPLNTNNFQDRNMSSSAEQRPCCERTGPAFFLYGRLQGSSR